MAGKSMKTIFDVLARDMATPVLNKVSGSFGQMRAAAAQVNTTLGGMNQGVALMQKQMRNIMAGGIIGAGLVKAGSGLQQFVGEAVKGAGELEFELATLRGVSGATAEQMERLANAASKAGIETQFTPTEAVQGLTALAQQGFTTAQSLNTLMPSLFLAGASGGKVPLEEAAKLTTQTLKAFGLEADKAGITVDQLVKTTTVSGLAIEELTESLQNASAGAISLGLDVQESMAALGLIKNIIPSAAMAGSAFQIMTGRLASKKTQKVIRESMGIDVVDQATGKYKDFGNLLVEMADKMGKMTEGERGMMVGEAFGERAKKGILSIFQQLDKGITTTDGKVLKGAEAWKYYKAQLDPEDVEGFAQAMNDMKLDTLNGQVTLLTGSFQTFMMELGKGTAQITKGGVKALLATFNTFLSVFQELPEELKTAVTSFLLIGGTITKFVGIILIARTALRLFGFSLTNVFLGLGKMLLIGGAISLLFGGIALGAYGIYKAVSTNFGKSKAEGASFFETIKMGFRGIVDIVKTGGLTEETTKAFEKMGKSPGLASFFRRFIAMWEKAKAFFEGVSMGFTAALGRLEKPWEKFKETIGRVFNIFTGGAAGATKSTDEWTTKGEMFGDMLVMLAETLLTAVTRLTEFGAAVAENFKDVSLGDFIGALEKVIVLLDVIFTTVGVIGQIFKEVGTYLGEMFGMFVRLAQGFVEFHKGIFTGDFTAIKSGAKEMGSSLTDFFGFTGESENIIARGVKQLTGGGVASNVKKEQAKNISKAFTESQKQTAAAGVHAPRPMEGALVNELSKRLVDIKSELQKERVQVIEIDGQQLFAVLQERAGEASEENLDNPDMSPVPPIGY